MKYRYIDIVFDDPPSNKSGRFVEVEDEQGRSISAGTGLEGSGEYWILRLTPETFTGAPISDKGCPTCKEQIERMVLLLIECRDALPAITVERARLNRVKLDLDKRIEEAIQPWAVPPGTPGAI